MDSKIFKTIINYAIEKEVEASVFYEATSDLAESPNIKKIFKEMASVELKHKQALENITEESIDKYDFRNVPDLKIGDYMVDEDFRPNMNYQEVLILAIKREEKAHQLYSDLAENINDSEVKKLFQLLAQEEAKHKLSLETEYDENILVND